MGQEVADKPDYVTRLDKTNNRAIVELRHEPRMPTGIDVVLQRGNITVHFPEMLERGGDDTGVRGTPQVNTITPPTSDFPSVAVLPPETPTTDVEVVSHPFGVFICYDLDADPVAGELNVQEMFDPRWAEGFHQQFPPIPEPIDSTVNQTGSVSVANPVTVDESRVTEQLREWVPDNLMESRDGVTVSAEPEEIDPIAVDGEKSGLVEAIATVVDGELHLICRRFFTAIGTATKAEIIEGTTNAENTNRRQTADINIVSRTLRLPFPVAHGEAEFTMSAENGAELTASRSETGTTDGVVGAFTASYGPLVKEEGEETTYDEVSALLPSFPRDDEDEDTG